MGGRCRPIRKVFASARPGHHNPRMEPITLTTDRLRLRNPVPGDADAVYAICQDPAILRWTTVPDPTPGRTPTSS